MASIMSTTSMDPDRCIEIVTCGTCPTFTPYRRCRIRIPNLESPASFKEAKSRQRGTCQPIHANTLGKRQSQNKGAPVIHYMSILWASQRCHVLYNYASPLWAWPYRRSRLSLHVCRRPVMSSCRNETAPFHANCIGVIRHECRVSETTSHRWGFLTLLSIGILALVSSAAFAIKYRGLTPVMLSLRDYQPWMVVLENAR